MVAAGAAVTRDLPDFALVTGIHARHIGWVGRRSNPLKDDRGGRFVCPITGGRYFERDSALTDERP